MSPDDTPRLAAKARLQWDEVRQRHVLLFPEGLVALNPTAAEILQLCDGARSVSGIVTELERKYPGATVAPDVSELLDRLAAKRLVTHGV